MSDNLKALQVFIASPNDLVDERRAIKEVADSLSAAFGKEVGLQVQLLGWEDRLPGYGRPQAQINEDVDRADLFIGFLWRRWGSDPGNPKYTSGFEEEFNRALERRDNGSPLEICLFFKDIDKQSLSDPGDQLKRVLEFREAVTRSKKVLFRNFADAADWKEQTRDLLQRHLLKLLSSTMESRNKEQPQAPPSTSAEESGRDATGQKDKTSTSAARQQVVRVWNDALEAIKLGEMSGFSKSKSLDKLKIARLGLAAAGITNRDIEAELPGVHLTNLLFKHRNQIELTALEWLLVLRANLVPQVGYQPGWFWLKKTTLVVKGALIFLACSDDHASVRKAAISYARELGLLLRKRSNGKRRPIEVLCSHSDENSRKAALECLAEKGSAKDLPLVEKLRADSDNDVRSQAELARNAILLREDASQFFERSVLTSPWVSDGCLRLIQQHVGSITTELFRRALAHPDTKVQVFSAKELASESHITLAEIKALEGRDGACEAFQAYYLERINAGQRFETTEIRQALNPLGFGLDRYGSKADADLVVYELFKRYGYDELLTKVAISDDGPIAYRVLAETHFEKFGDIVRADLADDFSSLKGKLQPEETTATGPLPVAFALVWSARTTPTTVEFAEVGLLGLAKCGKPSDRGLILPFLTHKSDRVRIAAVAALRRVGLPEDTEISLQIAGEAGKALAVEAAKTALTLAPGETGSASRLLNSKKPELVRVAILSLISCDPKKVWPQLESRLYDEDEEIRKMVCAYAIRKLPTRRLAKLLDSYLSVDQYFYNVVYCLDRALYAKPPLRKLFIKEIEAVLD